MKTMDRYLISVLSVLLIYCIVDMWMFYRTGSEPSTLTACMFGVATGECGFLSWIKTSKERHEDREWVKEDRNEHN